MNLNVPGKAASSRIAEMLGMSQEMGIPIAPNGGNVAGVMGSKDEFW